MTYPIYSAAVAASAVLAAMVAATPAGADDFYKNRQVKLIIGNNVGTSYDITARLVGGHIAQHIPGNPRIVTQNMPGATGLIAANYVYNIAPKDGSVFSAAHQSLPMRQLFGDKSVKYDAAKLQWIGSPQSSVALVAVWHAAPIKTMEDGKKDVYVFGATTSRASAAIVIALANNLIGTKFKLALGYRGNHIDLAMERGEVHGRAGQSWAGWKSVRPDWIRDRKIRILAQLGLKRDPELPDVPLMSELAKDPRSRQILNLFAGQIDTGRPMYAAPGVPKERINILRAAFDATMKDAKFLAEAKRLNHEIQPTSGVELDRLVAEMMATPKELLADAEKAMEYGTSYESCQARSGADKKACAAKKTKKKKKKAE
ncbi:MAG: Bug family tripartite tricarboxylate transporter substrate binding protein [Alphaproteobacteria bacterium]